jgi:Skp family chaperone for outer membrane proteins
MKKSVQILLLLVCLLASAPSALAQGKIGVVDLRKLFDKYYKKDQATVNLQEDMGEKEKLLKEMIDEYKKQDEGYKKMLEKANDPAVSSEEHEKSKQAAEKKLLELKEREQEIDQYRKRALTELEEKKRRMHDKILQEIRDVINAKAKAENYFLIIDTAAETTSGSPVVLYTNGDNNITDAILTQLNATAPIVKPDEKKEPKDGKAAK